MCNDRLYKAHASTFDRNDELSRYYHAWHCARFNASLLLSL